MPELATTAAVADAPVAAKPAKAKKAGKAKANGKPAKKAAKKATKPAKAKKASTPRGDSIRLRTFRLLAKGEMTGRAVMEKLGLKGVPACLKDEALCDNPRIKRTSTPTETGADGPTHYQLTAAGRKALEKGTVDSEAAPRSIGQR